MLLALSGLALFYPAFFWLTGVFGTPQLARIVHPFVGVIMVAGFFVQFFRYFKHNFIDREDVKWMLAVKQALLGVEVGDIGKYNGGQKGMFWLMTLCVLVLACTGFIIWRPYFAPMFPIPVIRLALLFHAWSALILIAGIIIHVYAACGCAVPSVRWSKAWSRLPGPKSITRAGIVKSRTSSSKPAPAD